MFEFKMDIISLFARKRVLSCKNKKRKNLLREDNPGHESRNCPWNKNARYPMPNIRDAAGKPY